MRYDRGFGRGYDRGWQGGPPPRYDEMFRGMQGREEGPPNWRRGRDAGRMGWRDVPPAPGPGFHPAWNQHPAAGETDFMGRPYPAEAMDDRPWGLMEQDQRQARHAGPARGYDRGHGGDFRGYDAGHRGAARGPSAGRGRYDAEHGMRPGAYRPRFGPDGDGAGMDAHRFGRGGDMRYTSSWTRWF